MPSQFTIDFLTTIATSALVAVTVLTTVATVVGTLTYWFTRERAAAPAPTPAVRSIAEPMWVAARRVEAVPASIAG